MVVDRVRNDGSLGRLQKAEVCPAELADQSVEVNLQQQNDTLRGTANRRNLGTSRGRLVGDQRETGQSGVTLCPVLTGRRLANSLLENAPIPSTA